MTVVCRRSQPGEAFVPRTLLCATIGLLLLLGAGCGSNSVQNGTPVLTVSSTNARFTAFIVNINSLTLTRDDNNVFTAFGAVERADLTKVATISELLGAPAIPSGTYHTAAMSVDFTGAVVYVNVNGQNVAATLVDPSGAPLTSATLTFNLDKAKPLVINTAQSVRFAMDFDLVASTAINTSTSPVTVTVNPFVVASVVAQNGNPSRVHGAFLNADVGAGRLTLNSRPFTDTVNAFGAVQVVTSASTAFDINGKTYIGSAGLTALNALGLNSSIAAAGTFSSLANVVPELTATLVIAGSSLESGAADHMIGNVASRSGNVLTIKGANLLSRVGTNTYTDTATLTVGDSTVVNIDGQAATGLTKQSISVGQRIDIYGSTATDASGKVTIDATGGEVRLQPTRVWGTLNSATTGSANLSLLWVDGYGIAAFNFAGTGSAADANATSYLVNTGSLDQSATAPSTLLRIDGLPSAFGAAPPAFNATAITPGTAVDSILQVEWTGGTTAPFSSVNNSGLVVNLGNAKLGKVHEIVTGPQSKDLTTLSASPLIVSDAGNGTNYTVGNGGVTTTLSNYSSFADFIAQVGTTLNGTNVALKLVAVGRYDAGSNTFTAKHISLLE